MSLPFLDRSNELRRLRKALTDPEGSLVCVYGRRRLGKSRLLREALAEVPAVFFVGDDRDAALQRAALATEVARFLPGFADVAYPDWDALVSRFWRDASRSLPLVLDEFPALVASAPELPAILQRHIDQGNRPLALCGSSQRMMYGLVLDSSAPLYGRAMQILRIEPLDICWIRRALGLRSAIQAVEHFAVFGGVPRYWELARDCLRRGEDPIAELVLDPHGVLHREPDRLLADDLRETTRSTSILSLIGRGCCRLSEIGGRLQISATSLSRPLALLIDLGLVVREMPFGRSERDSKRSAYRIADPFLAFWFRFVEPNRSRLAAGQIVAVRQAIAEAWPQFLGEAWERIARTSVARIEIAAARWQPAGRFWGPANEGPPIEIDILAAHGADPGRMLVGEVKLSATATEARATLAELAGKAHRCPELAGRRVDLALFVLRPKGRITDPRVLSGDAIVGTC